MKKCYLFLAVFFIFFSASNALFAQGKAYATHVNYKNMRYPAIAIPIDVPAEVVRVALDEELKRHGLKGKNSANFRTYENVVFSLVSRKTMSFYTVVESVVSTTSYEKAIVYIMAVNTNPVLFIDQSTDLTTFNNLKYFLEDFEKSARKTYLEVQIDNQFNLIEKSEKQISSLINDSLVIERRKSSLDQKAREIEKNLIIHRNSLNVQKAILDDLFKQKGR